MWKLFRFSSRTPPEQSGAEAERGWTGFLSKTSTTHALIILELAAKKLRVSSTILLRDFIITSRKGTRILFSPEQWTLLQWIRTASSLLSLIIRFAYRQFYSSLRNLQPGGRVKTFNRYLFFFCPHLCSRIRGGLQQYQLNYSPLWLRIIENHWELLRVILLFDREGRLKVISSLERPGGSHYRSQ